MDNYETGAILSFGGYDWRVLETQPDRLLITEKIIEQRPYHAIQLSTELLAPLEGI